MDDEPCESAFGRTQRPASVLDGELEARRRAAHRVRRELRGLGWQVVSFGRLARRVLKAREPEAGLAYHLLVLWALGATEERLRFRLVVELPRIEVVVTGRRGRLTDGVAEFARALEARLTGGDARNDGGDRNDPP